MRLFERLPALALLSLSVLLPSAACGIDEVLEGAPCLEDDDCPKLTCVRTATEVSQNLAGLCSADASCIPGEQAGCVANGEGMCPPSSLLEVPSGDTTFCCEVASGMAGVVLSVAEDGTAECYDCDPCDSAGMEPCLAEEERCVVDEGEPCGCRVQSDALLNAPCDDDNACGDFTCHRTLEQEEEPDETQVSEQGLDPGQCRADGTCEGGFQPGCRLPAGSSCAGATEARDVGPLTFCCPEAANTDFTPVVYAITADESSAACTVCERRVCDDEQGNQTADECTALSDPGCIVPPGELCGCPPT